jgi:peptide/nickel transport system permease protein
MLNFVISRMRWTFLTILAVLTFVFFLARLTGDPVRLMLPEQATAAEVDAMREALGLNKPILLQYFDFLWHIGQGDLGMSLRYGRPAIQLVLERLPATLQLAVTSFTIGFAVALALAMLAEITRSRALRTAFLWAATIRQSIPPYVFGILLILIFSVHFGLLPAMGRSSYASYVIPVVTISSFEIALYLRLINNSFDETRSLDWVRTARAKGASPLRIVFRHMLPNALLPVITVAGLNLGILVGGIVVLEMVFNWPGIGRLIVEGVTLRDYPVVQAGVLATSTVFIAINLVVDLLYAVLDPRVRLT